MRKPFVAGNWKLHGTRESAAALARAVIDGLPDAVGCEVAVCPAFVHLGEVARVLRDSGVALGAQDVSAEDQGAFTGEVAAAMLREFECSYAIVGHSERRALYAEGDCLVARKFMAAQRAGLTPILCVGETLEQREAGETATVVGRQLKAVLDAAGIAAFTRAVVAYEPVWAIGTGRTATPDQAQEVHALIRAALAAAAPPQEGGQSAAIAAGTRILYGGSVKASNAAEIFAKPDVDGGLIGGASLDPNQFVQICQAAR
jgi:triosephosphate isomerase